MSSPTASASKDRHKSGIEQFDSLAENERNGKVERSEDSVRAQNRILEIFDLHAEMLRTIACPSDPVIAPVASTLLEFRRSGISTGEWRNFCGELRNHPLVSCLHEDPCTSHGFRKPRGYPGDAALLDFIYGLGASSAAVTAATPLGSSLYRECFHHSSFKAIRDRRDDLATRLLELGKTRGKVDVLSVACGHLREGHALADLPEADRPARFVAVDQDPLTLEQVSTDHRAIYIRTERATVMDLIRSGRELGTFDFIYSAGLYDYLSDSVSFRLLSSLSKMLRPGGRLLVANMTPDLSSAGYMEAVMDWWLEFRTAAQLESLGNRLVTGSPHLAAQVSARRFVAYLEIDFCASTCI